MGVKLTDRLGLALELAAAAVAVGLGDALSVPELCWEACAVGCREALALAPAREVDAVLLGVCEAAGAAAEGEGATAVGDCAAGVGDGVSLGDVVAAREGDLENDFDLEILFVMEVDLVEVRLAVTATPPPGPFDGLADTVIELDFLTSSRGRTSDSTTKATVA